MAKGSGRFRNRKLGFKTRINVEIGVIIEEDPIDAELDIEDDKAHKGVETGVDKDEEGEVHLQQVIASAAAYVGSTPSRADKGKKREEAFIPTRASQTIPDKEYRALYRGGYVDPVSYIRFSDTVEDTQRGAVFYTMDEDDEDWLEDFNAQFLPGAKPRPPAPRASSHDTDDAAGPGTPSGRSARAKGKHTPSSPSGPSTSAAPSSSALDALPPPTAALSEDDFEQLMELFEQTTDRKAPMAHVNISLLPRLDDMDDALLDPLRPELARLRPYAREVYPHWRARRVARGGKPVIPQLDYDESNENNPYVCFRRRDVKTARKTRRSDQQNLERLVRLRNDLYAAHALLVKVQERERLKLDALLLERAVFDQRCEMRDLKRRLNEPDGDEELLISRREKKRRREEQGAGSLRLSLRKTDLNVLSPASLVLPLEELQARKQRNDLIHKQIERDLARKRQADAHWEDWTDAAFLSRPPPTPARFWRAVEPVPNSVPFNGPAGRREALGFATQYQSPLGRVRTSFRKRVGRGGRILLDRIGPAKRGDVVDGLAVKRADGASDAEGAEEEEDEWLAARRRERLRYDTDEGLDFVAADEPTLIDDYDLPYLLRRVALLKQADIESLSLDSTYLDEAFKHAALDPDRNTPAPVVIGRPPQRPPLQMAPTQAAAGASAAFAQVQAQAQAAAAAQAQAAAGQTPGASAAYAQAQAQAQVQAQAMRLAQQQQVMRKQQALAAAQAAAGTGGPPDAMRRTPSQSGAGASPHSPLAPNGMALTAGLGGVGMNGVVVGQDGKGQVILSPNFAAQHGAQQLPLSPLGANGGVPLPRPGGANGLQATSRLSGLPYANTQALQLAIQQQQQAQLAAAAAGSPVPMGQLQPRPMSSNGAPSRPTSAASSHHLSPHLGGTAALPGALSPGGGVRANGGLATPPPGTQPPRASPMTQAQAQGMYAAQMAAQVHQQQAAAQAKQQATPQYGGF
ncbi:hypothetical protein JCM3770_003187 [Rhodotorula araucariae]